jgi:hypothetical protein
MAFRSSYRPVDNSSLYSTVLTKPGCNLRAWFPVFQHPTILKPFGAPDETGTIQPWRTDDEYDGFTDWIHGIHIVCKAGTERKVTFLADLKDRSDFGDETPYSRLLTVVRQLARSKNPDFENLLKSVNQQSPAVPKVENAVAIQGMLLMHGGKNYMANPVIDMFMVLVKTAHDALLEKLNVRSDTPTDPDIAKRWKSGNVVDPASGKVIQVFAAGQAGGLQQVQWNAAGNASQQKGKDFARYDCDIVDTQAPPAPLTGLMQDHFKPWDNVFHRLEAGEMVEQLCSAYKPDLIAKAFLDSAFEDLVPQRIRAKFGAATKFVPGFSAPAPMGTAATAPSSGITGVAPLPQGAAYFNAQSQRADDTEAQTPAGPVGLEDQINTLKAMAEKMKQNSKR